MPSVGGAILRLLRHHQLPLFTRRYAMCHSVPAWTSLSGAGAGKPSSRPASRSDSFRNAAPKLGFSYRLAEGARLFGNLARLSKAGIPVISILHGSSTAGGAYMPLDLAYPQALLQKILHEAEYSGYISVEVFDFNPDPQAIAGRSIGYLQGILESFGASAQPAAIKPNL